MTILEMIAANHYSVDYNKENNITDECKDNRD